MRLLGFDVETTGLDTGTDRITEIGLALWCTEQKRPLVTFGTFLTDDAIQARANVPEVRSMMERVCGITPELLSEFGTEPKKNFLWLDSFCERHRVDYIVSHNGENYDRPILMAELKRHEVFTPCLSALPWIDTRVDIPFAQEPDSRKLKHLALDAGFINPFAHRAIFDVLTMLRVLSNYDLEKVIAYSKVPFITLRALVDYKDREQAKARRFSWEKIGDKTYPKMWIKRIKQDQLEKEQQGCPFKMVQLEEKSYA